MEPKEYDFEFPRGDTCPLEFKLLDYNGNILKLSETDEIYFTIKNNYNKDNIVFQKKYSRGEIEQSEDGTCNLMILSEDTNKLKYGSYVYDICIVSGEYTKTLVLGQITLTNEATFKINE